MNPVVLETMNDILNQVETREWKRVTQQRDVLLRRNKRQSKQIQSMEDDWAVATEKLGQENSDLHNEIKRMKDTRLEDAKMERGVILYLRKKVDSYESERKIFAKREQIFRDVNQKLHELIEGLSGVCIDDFEDHESYVDDVNQQIHDDQKEREREIDDLKHEIEKLRKFKDWCLSDEMKEQTSAETIEEFEQDVRDNWDEIENLKSSLMNSSGSFNCDKCRIHLTEDDVYRSVDDGELLCESCAEGDDDSDEESLDECFCCEKRFDSHNARYNMGDSLRLKYEKYYGSENDDGDICPECINKNY